MNIMVIVAHPNLEGSRANRALMLELSNHAHINVRNLYREYPNWNIDVDKEQQLLLAYDRIIFQFPFYWYSCPPLLKKWFDDVLTYGWAFGPGGDYLKGKEFIIATTGGPENCYRAGGDNWFTISEFLKPLQRTITKCNGNYLPAFVTYGATSQGNDIDLSQEAKRYVDHIQATSSLLVH